MDKYINSEIRNLSIANGKLALILKIIEDQPKDYSYFYEYLGFSKYDSGEDGKDYYEYRERLIKKYDK